jgi:hypothetical protein
MAATTTKGASESTEGMDHSYLTSGIEADALASLFRAAASLFRAQPWSVVPHAEDIFSVTIEALDVRDAAVSIVGQMGNDRGFLVFANAEDFDAYVDVCVAVMDGAELSSIPPHFALNFDRDADVSPALRKEFADQRWEIAGPDAYPSLVAFDADTIARLPTAREQTILEAIARALTEVVTEKDELAHAWTGDAAFSRTLTVATHAGPIAITLRAPYDDGASPSEPMPDDLLAALAELEDEDDEVDSDRRIELQDELVKRFCASPEAKSLTDVESCHLVMNMGAEHLGKTIASLDADDLDEIIFELFPEKVSIDASEASWIVEENRAFFGFLKREYGFEQADACLRVLGGDAAKRLERALSDRRNFGMAKSLMMAGRDAGFDVSSREGVEAWMKQFQGGSLPPSFTQPSMPGMPSPRPKDPAAARARKNKRKAERKARKKNR